MRDPLPSAETVRRMAEALEPLAQLATQFGYLTGIDPSAPLGGGLLVKHAVIASDALALYRSDLDRQKPLQQQIEEMEDGNASG